MAPASSRPLVAAYLLVGLAVVNLAWAEYVAPPPMPDSAFTTKAIKESPTVRQIEVKFPSPRPSDDEYNNTVRAVCWLPVSDKPVPAVIVLHPLQSGSGPLETRTCQALNRHGLAAMVMDLPYHASRRPPVKNAKTGFMSEEFNDSTAAIEQALADVSGCVDWLCHQREIDQSRLGIAGISLGAILALSASQHEPRFSAAVSIMGSGDLPAVYAEGLLTAPQYQKMKRRGITKTSMKNWLGDLDPLYAAGKNPNCHVYMIAARHDVVIPARCVKETWAAYGRPPISWLNNSGTLSAFLALNGMLDAAARFAAVQFGLEKGPFKPPCWKTPHVRLGVNYSPTEGDLSPTVVVGVYPIDPQGILVLDLGAWTEGTFAGVSARVYDRLRVGAGYPLTGHLDDPFAYLEASVTF